MYGAPEPQPCPSSTYRGLSLRSSDCCIHQLHELLANLALLSRIATGTGTSTGASSSGGAGCPLALLFGHGGCTTSTLQVS